MESTNLDDLVVLADLQLFRQVVLSHSPASSGAATELRELAHEVTTYGSMGMDAFAGLVDDPDLEVSLQAAHHLVDFMNAEGTIRVRALEVIERAATGTGSTSAAEQRWLENWRAEQQNE